MKFLEAVDHRADIDSIFRKKWILLTPSNSVFLKEGCQRAIGRTDVAKSNKPGQNAAKTGQNAAKTAKNAARTRPKPAKTYYLRKVETIRKSVKPSFLSSF